ncbi:MAG: HAD-IA family hydrolase [Ruminococcaceae bacterium]|nr:HAD-IA family hydrolase [Oscillospiraceae bacterium]
MPTSPKPELFWDFHGTLTLPDINWFDAAMEAAAEQVPARPLNRQTLVRYFKGTCLPWFSIPSHDTRHLMPPGRWWAHCEAEFAAMFQRCGFTPEEAARIAPAMREKILQPHRYQLWPDAASTLQALQERGYRSYILSNNFPELGQIIQALGLASYFELVLISAQIGYDKPHPGIFAYAKSTVPASSSVWMIGDNPTDDIEGGRAAGFTTVAVHGVEAPRAHHHAPHLTDLLYLLQ